MKAPSSTKATFDLTRSVSKSGKSFDNLFEATYNQSNGEGMCGLSQSQGNCVIIQIKIR